VVKESKVHQKKQERPQNKNLRPSPPWKKGQSGNPKGRPKGSLSLTEHLKAQLRANDGAEARAVVVAVVEGAKGGDAALQKLAWDRVDGPVAQRVVLEGELQRMLDTAQRVLPNEHYRALLEALTSDAGS
jgi:hypothetical protein